MRMNWEKVYFTNSRNLKLAGLLYGTPDCQGPVVIVCHGLAGGKEGNGRAIEMAIELGQRGWSTFLFDFSGVGESEGVFKNLTLSGQIDDLTSAINWCLSQGFTQIITQGRSFGGSTVLGQAAGDKRVSGVCTWAAPADLSRLVLGFVEKSQSNSKDILTFQKDTEVVYLKRDFLDDLENHDLEACSALISPRPLLVIHGTEDLSVPFREAEMIYSAAGEPKKLALIEGADHQFTRHYQQVWELFFNWLDENFCNFRADSN